MTNAHKELPDLFTRNHLRAWVERSQRSEEWDYIYSEMLSFISEEDEPSTGWEWNNVMWCMVRDGKIRV